MRHHPIFVLIFLIHLQLIASLTPQEACKNFFMIYWKYLSLGDLGILHKDFKYLYSNGNDVTEIYKEGWKADYGVEWNRKRYEEARNNSFWETYWDHHVAQFTPGGLLEQKRLSNNELKFKYLMISDSNVEGGYKLYKILDFRH
ncbi:unnamed protein product [Caenorhabditis angaria]|uniref:Uncharacterized protein n=1 Tax=Caenorhabditis angaria TaxID=860376 RepID=A0A9P1ICQ4_9PELO|nr:unnamed protein product [Caenorhabditis angaria]